MNLHELNINKIALIAGDNNIQLDGYTPISEANWDKILYTIR